MRKRCRAGNRRRASEELRVPVSRDRANLKSRRGSFNLNQHNNGGSNRNGSRGVQHDAKRAVIRVGVERVDVRHLRHRNDRDQHQTHEKHGGISARLAAAITANQCLKFSQCYVPDWKGPN